MKKIFVFLLVLNFFKINLFCLDSNALYDSGNKEVHDFLFKDNINKKVISDVVLQVVADMCQNLQQIVSSYQGVEEQTLNLLQTSFDLTSQVLKKDHKNYDLVHYLFLQLVCDLFGMLELNKIDICSIGGNFTHMPKIAKSKTRDSRQNFAKKIMESDEEKTKKEFTNEFCIVLSGYLKNDLNIVIDDMQSKLLFCFEGDITQNFTEPLIFKKKKKKKIAAAIFAALANVCIQLAQIITGKKEEDKKAGVLNLAGTVFSLASKINSINAEEQVDSNRVVKMEQESILNSTVQLIQDLYTIIKHQNIPLEKIEESYWVQKLDSLDSDVKRKAWITQALLSRDLTKKLIKAIFKCLKICMHYVMDSLIDILNDKLLEYLKEHKHAKK